MFCINSLYTGIGFQQSIQQHMRIGDENDVAPSRREAITWNNDALIYGLIYASLGIDVLIKYIYGTCLSCVKVSDIELSMTLRILLILIQISRGEKFKLIIFSVSLNVKNDRYM